MNCHLGDEDQPLCFGFCHSKGVYFWLLILCRIFLWNATETTRYQTTFSEYLQDLSHDIVELRRCLSGIFGDLSFSNDKNRQEISVVPICFSDASFQIVHIHTPCIITYKSMKKLMIMEVVIMSNNLRPVGLECDALWDLYNVLKDQSW